jgi:hypothetical protein
MPSAIMLGGARPVAFGPYACDGAAQVASTCGEYVNNVIKGKLLESQELLIQASNNTKAQFANSPTLSKEIMNAVMDAFAAHTTMSKQAIY